jgi:MoaA/NifB/PqqE/SkfB family radical SAM enzyme
MDSLDKIKWLQIEPTRICNMRCTYCDRTITGTNGMSMSCEIFHKIVEGIKELKNLKSILIQGFGEPLLYKKLEYMVNTLREQCTNLSIQTVTNGMVMNETIERVITNIDVMYCSIDSLEEDYWKKVRIGGNIETIKANLMKLLAINKKLQIVLNVVVSEINMKDLFDICDFAEKIGCVGVQLIPIYEFVEETHSNNTAQIFLIMRRTLEQLRERFHIEIYGPYDCDEGATCLWIEKAAYILYDGTVTPCCVMSSDDQIIYGNLQENTLEEILRSNERNELFEKSNCIERCIECKSLYFNRIWNEEKELPLIK